MLRPLWLALGLLTRIPIPNLGEIGQGEQGRSLLWYPVVGLIIGVILAITAWALQSIDDLVVSAVLVILWTGITGALHLDGLADSADAWLGSHGNMDRALEIMKDPACGPAGVVAIVSMLLLKFAAIQAVIGNDGYLFLIIAPALARLVPPMLLSTTPYLRQGGMASEMVKEIEKRPIIFVVFVISALAIAVTGVTGIGLLLAAGMAYWLLRWAVTQWLGGTTGDTVGAMIELTEAAVLLAAVV